MTQLRYDEGDDNDLVIDLYDNRLAALLAWLWPGAGHFYQRRFAKGFLFMVCILGTFLMGLRIGGGRVVYASLKGEDFRWQYFCQAAIGIPALPAMVQSVVMRNGADPIWVMCERYPKIKDARGNLVDYVIDGKPVTYQRIDPARSATVPGSLKDGFMAPPAGKIDLNENDVLGMWHVELGNWFEIGTFYTVIAGLLNLLAIYDAFAGPVILATVQDPFKEE